MGETVPHVDIFDMDGVVIARPLPFQFKAGLHKLRNGNAIYDPPQIPDSLLAIDDSTIGFFESVSLRFHSLRTVRADAKAFLESRESMKFGNTGRVWKDEWEKVTRKTLEDGGVSHHFIDIFHKPTGVKTLLHKGSVIRMLADEYPDCELTHYDDNPEDVLGLAKVFPDVHFVIVQDLSTGILMYHVELRDYPNVIRVAELTDGRLPAFSER